MRRSDHHHVEVAADVLEEQGHWPLGSAAAPLVHERWWATETIGPAKQDGDGYGATFPDSDGSSAAVQEQGYGDLGYADGNGGVGRGQYDDADDALW